VRVSRGFTGHGHLVLIDAEVLGGSPRRVEEGPALLDVPRDDRGAISTNGLVARDCSSDRTGVIE
jgi:hypothetical protein